MNRFRTLRADEIDCRVSQIKKNGLTLLLYKDARCDQNILDETVGPMNWQRFHSRDNANCTVQIWDEEKKQWVGKEDVGTPSNTEADKGLASDSFKRACFNWGIGRELYSAPFVFIPAAKCSIIEGNNGKPACYDRFRVMQIGYREDGARDICELVIANDKTGEIVYTWTDRDARQAANAEPPKAPPAPRKNNAQLVIAWCKEHGMNTDKFGHWRDCAVDGGIIPNKKVNELTEKELADLIRFVELNKDAGAA